MTVAEFRRLALSFPETAEASHMDHPDFRVRGKIFATLGYPNAAWAMVRLTPKQQAAFMQRLPDALEPAAGKWGERGATLVMLRKADKKTMREAMFSAWSNTAPKTAVREYVKSGGGGSA